jgi:hypothetical protein
MSGSRCDDSKESRGVIEKRNDPTHLSSHVSDSRHQARSKIITTVLFF